MTSVTAACNPVDDYRISPGQSVKTDKSDAGKPVMIDVPPIKRRASTAAGGGKAPARAATGEAGAGGSLSAPAEGGGGDGAEREQEGAEAGSGAKGGEETPQAPLAPESPKHDQAGWAAMLDWNGLPTFSDVAPELFSTHERGEGQTFSLIDAGNKDFNSFLAICGDLPTLIDQQNDAEVMCASGERGYLVAADDGPGYISRILMARGVTNPNSSVLVNTKPTDEHIRIYIDGSSTPAFDNTWMEWAEASKAPFDAPLTHFTSGGTTSYLPISYSSKVRVFVDNLQATPALHYVQVDTRRVKQTKPFDASALASDDAKAAFATLLGHAQGEGASWFDQQVTLEGAVTQTVWTRDKPGTIQRVQLTLPHDAAAETLRDTTLRVSWDGVAEPAIDVPLDALLGVRHTLSPLSTLPLNVSVSDSEVKLILSLPMPFARSAKLQLVHATETKQVLGLSVLGTVEVPRGEWGRLHAELSQKSSPTAGERFGVAALSGRGKYVGTLLYAKGKADSGVNTSTELGFLEGDERLEIDGKVAGLGTGTDNFFNGGFYFVDGVFNSPFAAVSQLTASSSERTSEGTFVRWTILTDALNFAEKFQLSFEFGADHPASVREYAAVSFYYQ